MITNHLYYPNEIIPSSNFKMWLRTWSNDLSSGANYLADNFTLNFQNQTGTVSTTSGSAIVTGSGTNFTVADVGKRIRINSEDRWVASVQSSTQLTLEVFWLGEGTYPATQSGVAYAYAFISTWKDKSGSNFHVSQATASAQPLLQYNATLRRIEVYFNGTGHFLLSNSPYNVGSGPRGFHFLYKKLTDNFPLMTIGSQNGGEAIQSCECSCINTNELRTSYSSDLGAGSQLRIQTVPGNNIYKLNSFYQSAASYSNAWFIRNNGIMSQITSSGSGAYDIGSRYIGIARTVDPQAGQHFYSMIHIEIIFHTFSGFTHEKSAQLEKYMAFVNRHTY